MNTLVRSSRRLVKRGILLVAVMATLAMGSMSTLASGLSAIAPDRIDRATFMVTNTADSGPGSLRQAIHDANSHPGPDEIHFQIAAGPEAERKYVIWVASLLPPVIDAVLIDGTTQQGYSPKVGPVVEINGAQLLKTCSGVESGYYRDNPGLDIAGPGASGTMVKGLKISSFCQGISISANVAGFQQPCQNSDPRIGNVTIEGNLIEGNLGGNAALDLCNVAQSKLLNNQLRHNGDHIEITNSQYITVTKNDGLYAQDALELVGDGTRYVTVEDNRFSNNRRSGITMVFGASHSQFVNNRIADVATSGLILADDNVARGNEISRAGWFGIEVRHGSRNVVSENRVTHNGLAGIAVSAALFNALFGCTLNTNGTPVNCESTAVFGSGDAFDNMVRNNEVAFNGGPGILMGGTYTDADGTVRKAARNSVVGNTIYGNAGLGIDLSDKMQRLYLAAEEPIVGVYAEFVIAGPDGPTPDTKALLTNDGRNAPALSSAVRTPGKLSVQGTLNTANPETVMIEIYANRLPNPGGDPSGYGEGALFLGRVRPDVQGGFGALLPPMPPGTLISATATDAAGNTSEFSTNIAVVGR